MVKSFLLGIALSASVVCFAAVPDEASTRTTAEPSSTELARTPLPIVQRIPAVTLPLEEKENLPPTNPYSDRPTSLQPQHEFWQYAQLDERGYVRVPWSIYPLDPYTVFNRLKDDPVNQSKMPSYVWNHIAGYSQAALFQDAFVTKTDHICLPNARNTLVSREPAYSELWALRQNGYDLRYFISTETLQFLGLLA